MKSLSVKLGVIFVLSGLAIFGNAEVCKAQCAWVLWEELELFSIKDGKPTDNVVWKLIVATPKYEQCLENQRRLFEKIKKEADEDKEKYDTISKIEVVPYTFVMKDFKSGGFFSKTLKCLPDTIDPRK